MLRFCNLIFQTAPSAPLVVPYFIGWPTTVTAKANHSRRKQIRSRRKQITHGESKSFTAKANHSRRKQITHGESKFAHCEWLYRKRRLKTPKTKTEDPVNKDPENEDHEPESKLNGIHSPTLQIRVRGFCLGRGRLYCFPIGYDVT